MPRRRRPGVSTVIHAVGDLAKRERPTRRDNLAHGRKEMDFACVALRRAMHVAGARGWRLFS
jgi:hypothetical protein